MRDVCVYVENARAPHAADDRVDTWFAPGRVVLLERLVERRFTVGRLFSLPFHYAYMCIRDEQLAMFHVDMLARFDERFRSLDILFSPWLEDLEAATCARIGLTMERLLRDGLTRRHVRTLRLRMSAWSELFGLDTATLELLGITNYGEFFDDVATDLGRGGCAAGVPRIEL